MLLNKFEKHKILRSDSRSLVGDRRGCPPPRCNLQRSQSCKPQKYAFLRRKRGKNKRSRYKIYIYSFAAKNAPKKRLFEKSILIFKTLQSIIKILPF